MKKILTIALTLLISFASLNLNPKRASADTLKTTNEPIKVASRLGLPGGGGVEPNVALPPDEGGCYWYEYHISEQEIAPRTSNATVKVLTTGFIVNWLRGEEATIGDQTWKLGNNGILAAGVVVAGIYDMLWNSIFSFETYYFRTYLFLYTDGDGRRYYISDCYVLDANHNEKSRSLGTKTYY